MFHLDHFLFAVIKEPACYDHYRDIPVLCCLEGFYDLETALTREHHVQDNKVRTVRCHRFKYLIACCKAGRIVPFAFQSVFKHIDYFANLVGPEHVGLGLDHVYDAPSLIYFTQLEADRWPASGGYSRPDVIFYGPEGLPQLTEVMLAHGYAEADIRGILGENWLRVCRQIWK